MGEVLEDVRKALGADRARKLVRQPYGAKVREQVVAYAREQRARGTSWAKLGRQLGMSATTLRRYVLKAGRNAENQTPEAVGGATRPAEPRARPSAAAPVPVKVSLATPARTSRSMVLVSPSGFRLEGLDLEGAVQLLAYLR